MASQAQHARITVAEVKPGHSIPNLDNGYVFEVEENNGYFSTPGGGRFSTQMDDDIICISMHDGMGNEFYLLAHGDMPITVDQVEPQWVG